jgi:hypothetical protein
MSSFFDFMQNLHSVFYAPAYKIAKRLTEEMKQIISLPNTFNVVTSLQLMEELSKI